MAAAALLSGKTCSGALWIKPLWMNCSKKVAQQNRLILISKAGKEYSAYLKIELGQVKLEFANTPRASVPAQNDSPYDMPTYDNMPCDIPPEDMPPPLPLPGEEPHS